MSILVGVLREEYQRKFKGYKLTNNKEYLINIKRLWLCLFILGGFKAVKDLKKDIPGYIK